MTFAEGWAMTDDDEDVDLATDAKSVLGPAYVAARAARAGAQATSPVTRKPLGPAVRPAEASDTEDPVTPIQSLLSRLRSRAMDAVVPAPPCTAHAECGPVTRTGHSGHGHGPSEATGRWCWHFDEGWLGRPDEIAPEGSDLAARRAQQADVNGGDPFAHKTYTTDH